METIPKVTIRGNVMPNTPAREFMGETDTRRVALESGRPRTLWRFGAPGWIGLALIVALAGAGVWVGHREPAPPSTPEASAANSSLERVLSLRPLAAGRPSRGGAAIDDRQPSPVLAFGSSNAAIEVARATVEIERVQEEHGAERDLHVLGLLRGSEGRLDEAVLLIEGAHLEDPGRADVLADLAAVQLSRFAEEGDPQDLFEALATAELSLEREPASASALFNRALSLSWLHQPSQATAAWEEYLSTDATEPWASTARAELDRLRQPTLEDRWREVRRRLMPPAPRPSEEEIEGIVAEFPYRSRMLVLEDLLPRWGRAWRAGDRSAADAWMHRARNLASALESVTGDEQLSESVALTVDAVAALGLASHHQAEAYELLGRAVRLYHAQDYVEAGVPLRAARSLLQSTGDPLWSLPTFYLASGGQFLDAVGPAEVLLRLQREYPPDHYPYLSGLCDWVLGTLESTTGDSEEALRIFRDAQSKLGRSASDFAEGPVHVLLAEAHRLLGQEGAARREYLKGLEAAARVGDRRRYHMALFPVVEMLLEGNKPLAALSLSKELVANAVEEGSPHRLAEAHLQRGRARAQLGDGQGAAHDFQRARRFTGAIADPGLRERTAGELRLAEAELLTELDPSAAVELLDRAIENKLETDYFYNLTRALYLRGMAHVAFGALEEGRQDLLAAIEEYERLRRSSDSPEHRRSTFELAQRTFDALIALEVESGSPPMRSLALAERSRSRQIQDLLGDGNHGSVRSIHLPPPGLVFVEYSVLPDRLMTWLVSEAGVTLHTQEVPRADLERQVQSLRNALSRRAPEAELQTALALLYEHLIAPVAASLPPESLLAVVPDRFLARVPFHALYDRERDRYLIEDHPVTLSPAIRLYPEQRLGGPRGEVRSDRPLRALVIGGPELDREIYPELPALAAAREEAREVASLYSESRFLSGPDATADAFVREAADYEVIQFSGHARTSLDGSGGSSLILAPSESRSGVLGAGEIGSLDLRNTGLVVLSACSGLDGDRGGRESVTGLAAAFFAAGVPAVVASLWEVEDRASREVILRLHRAVAAGEGPVAALRGAQLALLRSPDSELSTPATWAGFTALGGGAEPDVQTP